MSTAGEELDAVIRHRVMRGGQDDTKVGAETVGEIGHTRRGQDPDAQHVDAGARQPGDNSGLEEFTGGTGVTAHHRDRPVALERSYITKDMCCRNGKIESQLGRQISIGDPAYPIGAEEMSQCHSLVVCAFMCPTTFSRLEGT